ncbi:MAG: divalent-cation tolerance protein CutA [Akkermansiaceae bacterium]
MEKQHAACINVLPAIESIYSWEGKLCHEQEVLLIIKTNRRAFPVLSRELTSLHPYEVPEIVALPVVDGSAKYLSWLLDQAR